MRGPSEISALLDRVEAADLGPHALVLTLTPTNDAVLRCPACREVIARP